MRSPHARFPLLVITVATATIITVTRATSLGGQTRPAVTVADFGKVETLSAR